MPPRRDDEPSQLSSGSNEGTEVRADLHENGRGDDENLQTMDFMLTLEATIPAPRLHRHVPAFTGSQAGVALIIFPVFVAAGPPRYYMV